MSYNSRVYRILIASPSDVEEEREIVVRAIQEWNDLHSFNRKVTLLPLRWETHTAPEYGTRPQEVINRAIVDNCDLLVGIFWTRIGTPTGAAESGTLEEIDRVGTAGKPIMLYFSKVGVDPDAIEFLQLEKLKRFKENSYPKGLLEHYKTRAEFRDKFVRQLELKVRDLQRNEEGGNVPLSLEFFSLEEQKLSGTFLEQIIINHKASEIPDLEDPLRSRLLDLLDSAIRQHACFPLLFAVENSSSSGIRNIYAELSFYSDSGKLQILDSIPGDRLSAAWSTFMIHNYSLASPDRSQRMKDLSANLERLQLMGKNRLQRGGAGWRVSFEWDALQPKRMRIIEPVLFVYTPESAEITVRSKIFADSFAEPLEFEATMQIHVKNEDVALSTLVPGWEKLLEQELPSGKVMVT